jgi:hypothetical protein
MKHRLSIAVRLGSLLVVTLLAASASPVLADSSTPVNYTGVNFAPITSTTSYNYDWSTGTLTAGTATASVFSTTNAVQNVVSDPSPPDPNGYGTFIGTGRPVRSPTGGGAVLYEQSVCAEGYPTCVADGSLTYGDMVMYTLRGVTLDQLTNLATEYYVEHGCFGGGSPRFSLHMSNGENIFVYLGTPPAFADCPPTNVWLSTGNLATDSAGLRWDTSQICPGTYYNTYSGAVTCAATFGLTINAIFLVTDGGWFGANAGTPDGQTFLFQDIQVNGVTRFP